MTARQYLNQYKVLTLAIEEEINTLSALESSARRMTTSYRNDVVQTVPAQRAVEDASSMLVDKKKYIEQLEEENKKLCAEIMINILLYCEEHATVMMYIYINDYTLEATGLSCGRKSRTWALEHKKNGEKLLQIAINEHPESFHLYESAIKYERLLPNRMKRQYKKV